MIEEYVIHWGLEQHPFLLAPDTRMMYVTGQYYECLERLKYAINTNKGGVLIISEDAGLGKTTTLLKLIEEMTEKYHENFRYAFVDHPTLTASQIIAQITESISGERVDDDKLNNLGRLKKALIRVRESGGRSIIIVDEGQMLCGARDVLQELRALINLTHESEYLHTFILSGQKALSDTIKDMPEFWQRLPVRFYFMPLKLNETKEMLKFRLQNAGLDERRRIFTEDALSMIHTFAGGSPRTIIALADLCLLVGYTSHVERIGFKEVTKAIHAMLGRGDSLHYVTGESVKREIPFTERVSSGSGENQGRAERPHIDAPLPEEKTPWQIRPFFAALAVILLLLVGAAGYHYLFEGSRTETRAAIKREAVKEEVRQAPEPSQTIVQQAKVPEGKPEQEQRAAVQEVKTAEVKPQGPASPRIPPAEERVEKRAPEEKKKPVRQALVVKDAANVRIDPTIRALRIGMIFKGQKVAILDEKADREGQKWYKVVVYGDKYGWIASSTSTVK